MKKPILNILLVSLVLLSISTGCASKKTITGEFVDCLIKVNADTEKKVDSELKIIDQNLYDTEEKLSSLEQVLIPAQEWIENQKVQLLEEHEYGSWHSRVTPDGLAQFRNDDYEISALEVLVYKIGTPDQKFDTVIRITDLKTKVSGDWGAVESELVGRKATLENDRRAKLEAGQLSATTLLSVIGYLGDWEILRIDGNTYSISGPGLGMAGDNITGKWTYYRASKEIIPADAQSSALQSILSPGF